MLIDACRLGTFGFFVGPEGSGLNGNYALSDMVSALQWVQENISVRILPFGHFGFDPLIYAGFRW